MSIYVSADEQTKKAYKKDVNDGKYKKSDGSLSDWMKEKSLQSNEGCDVLPKNSTRFNVILPDHEALNPENIVIAAEEKSSAPNSNNVILFTKPNNDKQSYFVAA